MRKPNTYDYPPGSSKLQYRLGPHMVAIARLNRSLTLDWSKTDLPEGTEVEVLEKDPKDGTTLVRLQEETFWVPSDALSTSR